MAKIIENNVLNRFKIGDWVISEDSDKIVCVTRINGRTFKGVIIAAKEESVNKPGFFHEKWVTHLFRKFHGTVEV